MEIKWEKLHERLHSEALKCLLCNVMRQYAQKASTFEGFVHCGIYMLEALTTDNDEAFTKDGAALLESFHKRLDGKIDETTKTEITSFLEANHDYIRERVKEVLDRATECPDFKLKSEA